MNDNPFRPYQIADELENGDIEYEVLYRIPARETWPEGDEVGFIEADDWKFWVGWEDGEVNTLTAFDPEWAGVFPGATKLMIMNNDAIDYGIER